jgi:hypothetical protein
MAQKHNLLMGGFRLAVRNWPAFFWTYVFNIGLAMLFTLPLYAQINAITANSLASERLSSAFDLGTMVGVFIKLGQGPGPATMGSYFSVPIYLLLYFLIVPGTLVCYQTGKPAKLFSLFGDGLAHFWRFVRITLVSLVVFIPVLGGLNALQNLWSAHVDKTIVGRPAFLLELAGLLIIALVGTAIRIYFDLMQVYTVQLGLQAESGVEGIKPKVWRQIRRTFKPAWKAFCANFIRLYVTFIFLCIIGLGAVVITARTAMHSLAQPKVWPMFLLAQAGLFILLFTRFWQRGAETILAMDNPMAIPVAEPVYAAPVEATTDTTQNGTESGAPEFSI